MIAKNTLQSIISKYYLGGKVESVKWNIEGGTLNIDFMAPTKDMIGMVNKKFFNKTGSSNATENYYSTLLHELTHWTAHKDRCNRDLSGRFGDSSYAFEELIAEFGAALQCCLLGITNNLKRNQHNILKAGLVRSKMIHKQSSKLCHLLTKQLLLLKNNKKK